MSLQEELNIEGELFQVVTFSLDKEEYGVDIRVIYEIIRVPEITKVPRAPEFIEGIINLRGKVIPILDLRKRFNKDEIERNKQTRIIVMEIFKMMIGVIVDSVSEVLRLPVASLDVPPPVLIGVDMNCVSAVGKLGEKILIILDPERVLPEQDHKLIGAYLEAIKRGSLGSVTKIIGSIQPGYKYFNNVETCKKEKNSISTWTFVLRRYTSKGIRVETSGFFAYYFA